MADYVAAARSYEAGVLDGSIPACKWVRLACERNRRDLQAGKFTFNVGAATRVCAFVETMPHILGPSAKPTVGPDGEMVYQTIRLEPWQCWMLTTIYGWLKADGKRRFRVALILVPRKNGKSAILSALANYHLTSDGEPGARCFSVATTRDQAKIVAETAYKMAERLPQYREYFGIRLGGNTKLTQVIKETASSMEPLSADAHTLDGLNISFAAVDELHAHKTRLVWDVVDTATGARLQPLICAISTAGVDTSGICYEQLTYVHRVLERSIEDETVFGVNYTIDESDDPLSEAALRKANPNYGVSVSPDDLRRKAVKAGASSAALNNFLTKHLNVWVRAESTWVPMQAWLDAGDRSLKPEQFKGAPCWIGVDLAETRDIAAVVQVFRPAPETYVLFGKYYLPSDTIAKSPIAQYPGWVNEQALTKTDGNQADYARIEDDIVTLCQSYRVQTVCFDRALAAQMLQSLQKRLGSKPALVTVNQSVDVMSPAMQTVERWLLAGQLKHDANPVMTWMMGNVVVQRNYKDEVFPRKAGGKDSPNKIDGPVALFTVAGSVVAGEQTNAPQLFFLGGSR